MQNYIRVFEDICDENLLEDCFTVCKECYSPATIGLQKTTLTSFRKVFTTNNNYKPLANSVQQKLYTIFSETATQYLSELDCESVYNPAINSLLKYEPCCFLKYTPGCFYKSHADEDFLCSRLGGLLRQLSFVLFVNDEFSGGQLHFPQHKIRVKPTKNSLVLFPSNWCFKHEVTPVLNGTRYSVVTWAGITC